MYFNISHRALVFGSLLSLFLAVCATPISPSQRSSENPGTGAVKKLKQFDIRNPATKTYPNRARGAPSGIPKVWQPDDGDNGSSSDDGDDNSWDDSSWDRD